MSSYLCTACKIIFDSLLKWSEHQLYHKECATDGFPERSHRCPMRCGMRFPILLSLSQHVHEHRVCEETPFEIVACEVRRLDVPQVVVDASVVEPISPVDFYYSGQTTPLSQEVSTKTPQKLAVPATVAVAGASAQQTPLKAATTDGDENVAEWKTVPLDLASLQSSGHSNGARIENLLTPKSSGFWEPRVDIEGFSTLRIDLTLADSYELREVCVDMENADCISSFKLYFGYQSPRALPAADVGLGFKSMIINESECSVGPTFVNAAANGDGAVTLVTPANFRKAKELMAGETCLKDVPIRWVAIVFEHTKRTSSRSLGFSTLVVRGIPGNGVDAQTGAVVRSKLGIVNGVLTHVADIVAPGQKLKTNSNDTTIGTDKRVEYSVEEGTEFERVAENDRIEAVHAAETVRLGARSAILVEPINSLQPPASSFLNPPAQPIVRSHPFDVGPYNTWLHKEFAEFEGRIIEDANRRHHISFVAHELTNRRSPAKDSIWKDFWYIAFAADGRPPIFWDHPTRCSYIGREAGSLADKGWVVKVASKVRNTKGIFTKVEATNHTLVGALYGVRVHEVGQCYPLNMLETDHLNPKANTNNIPDDHIENLQLVTGVYNKWKGSSLNRA